MSKNLEELGCRFICFILGKQPKGRVATSRCFLDLDGHFFCMSIKIGSMF